MFAAILLTALAFGQDAEPQIIGVAPGAELLRPSKPVYKINYQAYLLPEGHYDSCLLAAKNLPICKSSLTFCEEQSEWALSQAQETFQLARDQFKSDEGLVAKLSEQVVQLDADLVRTQGSLKQARSQRNLAWGITGGLIIGAVTVTAVAVGN